MLRHYFNARTLIFAGALALTFSPIRDTDAATATANLSVSATVGANCSISTGAVAFGAYDPVVTNASSALNATGTVSVSCTTGASTTVTLGEGSNANTGSTPSAPLRRLTDGSAHYLSYTLYSNAARTT